MKKLLGMLTLLLCSAHLSYGQTPSNSWLSTSESEQDTVVTASAPNRTADTIVRVDYHDNITIYYRFDKSEFDSTYLTNAEALEYIDQHLSDSLAYASLDSLSLTAKSSPDGPSSYNEKLSKQRAESLREFLVHRYPESESKIKVGHSGEDWDGLRAMVVESTKIPNKDEVLAIIDSDLRLDIKEYRIKQLDEGSSWRFITYNMLRYLRYGASAIFHYDIDYIKGRELAQAEPEPVVEPEPEPEPEPVAEEEAAAEPETELKPLLALKTNLLYDAITALNLELEIPLGQRWSIAGEWIFPWWSSSWKESSNRNCFQLLNGNIAAKYWFGDRTDRFVMTGWYLGLYAGAGVYDLERSKEGYQGDFFVSTGLSAGYAHTIFENRIPNGNLRMEYSLGVGVLRTDYDKYAEHWGIDDSWHTLRQESGTYTWFGPTSAKVSLVWLFNRKVTKEE